MTEVHDVLVKARALIADPERWCKNRSAKTATGLPIGAGAKDATSWCLAGAIERVAADDALFDSVYDILRPWTEGAPTAFNDDPDTTHADVLALFDRAIEATR